MGRLFARDITDLAEAFKTLTEADKITGLDTSNERRKILGALDETIDKYREQLKEEP